MQSGEITAQLNYTLRTFFFFVAPVPSARRDSCISRSSQLPLPSVSRSSKWWYCTRAVRCM